jgi:hypothetical protein
VTDEPDNPTGIQRLEPVIDTPVLLKDPLTDNVIEDPDNPIVPPVIFDEPVKG